MDARKVVLFGFAGALCLAPSLLGQVAIRGKVVVPPADRSEVEILLVPMLSRHDSGLLVLQNRFVPEAAVTTAVEPDGTFELKAPGPGMWHVRVEAPGYLGHEWALHPLLEPQQLPPVVLEASTEVEIRVVDSVGEPVAGVRVSATGRRDRRRRFRGRSRLWSKTNRVAVTDETGTVHLAKGKGERLDVTAFAAGYAVGTVAEADSGSLRMELVSATRVVRVEVRTATGQAAQKSLIQRDRWSYGITDDHGRLEVRIAAAGAVQITASAVGGSLASHTLRPEASEDPDQVLTLDLPAMRTTGGTVVDAESRRPIAGALVWAATDLSTRGRTDSAGSFSLPLVASGPAGSGSRLRGALSAAAAGYFPSRAGLPSQDGSPAAFALAPATRIRGFVTDGTGAAVDDAEISAQPVYSNGGEFRTARNNPPGAARTGADGSFALAGLVPRVTYRIRAQAEGRAPSEVEVGGLEARRETVGVEIVLSVGASAFGRVADQRGGAVAGAQIDLERSAAGAASLMRMRMADMSDPVLVEAVSDDRGEFEVEHLAPGSYNLRVEAPGFAPALVSVLEVPIEGGDFGTITLEVGVVIQGRVVDSDGRPLAGSRISGTSFDEVTSDEDGRFVIESLESGRKIDLTVLADGYAQRSVPGVEAPAGALEVVLEKSAKISGQVLGAGRRPLAGARVSVQGQGSLSVGGFGFRGGRSTAMTDSEGWFELSDVPAGPIRLAAVADGWRATEVENLEVAAGESLEGLEIILERGASITGRVLEATGKPVGEAYVRIRVDLQRRMFSRSTAVAAQTDGDGRYRLEGVEPGLRQVAVHVAGREIVRELEVKPGENRLDFSLEAGVEVSGRVVEIGGAPVADAMVSLRSRGGSWRLTGATQITGPDGTYTFEAVSDGSYEVQVEKEGFASTVSDRAFEVASSPVTGIEVQLERGATLRGRLLGLESEEAQRAEVYAVQITKRMFAAGIVRPDGSYEVRGLAPGSWTVGARIDGSGKTAEAQLELLAGAVDQVLDLEFESGLVLTGLVRQSGKPVTGAHVMTRGVGTQRTAMAKTDYAGRFRVTGLEPGAHELIIGGYGASSGHSETITLTGDDDIVIDLVTARLSGHVRDAETSAPLSGVSVFLEPLDGESDEGFRWMRGAEATDSEGFFRVEEVTSGNYRLKAEKTGYAGAELAVSVGASGSVEGLEVRLRPNLGVLLKLSSSLGGSPQELAAAVLDGPRVLEVGHHGTLAGGRVRLSTVPPGDWEVLVSVAGFAVESVRVESPSSVPVPVTLTPEARLEITVPDLRGDGVGAVVTLTGPNGRAFRNPGWGSLRTSWALYAGTTLVTGLPAGDWLLRVSASDGRAWQQTVTVRAGDVERVALR